jgi:hypothetical protein
MPLEGFEPSIPYGHRILSAARIPVPTQRLEKTLFYRLESDRQFLEETKLTQRKVSLRLVDGKERLSVKIAKIIYAPSDTKYDTIIFVHRDLKLAGLKLSENKKFDGYRKMLLTFADPNHDNSK